MNYTCELVRYIRILVGKRSIVWYMFEDFTISSSKVTLEIVEVIFRINFYKIYCRLKWRGPRINSRTLWLFLKPFWSATPSCYTRKCRELNKLVHKIYCGYLMSETYGWKLTLILTTIYIFSKPHNQSILWVYLA